MKLLRREHERRLLAQGRRNAARERTEDFKPIVKTVLSMGWGNLASVRTRSRGSRPRFWPMLMGFPELGRVRLSELAALRGPGGLRIERDRWFRPDKTLSAYARDRS
jgi:hypothetical protein